MGLCPSCWEQLNSRAPACPAWQCLPTGATQPGQASPQQTNVGRSCPNAGQPCGWCNALTKPSTAIPPVCLQDNGKPRAVARAADIPLTVDHLRYFAGWADKIHGTCYTWPGGARAGLPLPGSQHTWHHCRPAWCFCNALHVPALLLPSCSCPSCCPPSRQARPSPATATTLPTPCTSRSGWWARSARCAALCCAAGCVRAPGHGQDCV